MLFNKIVSLLTILCIVWNILSPGLVLAADNEDNFYFNKNDPKHKAGSVYFTSNKKDELLMRANIWGAVNFPGIHYVPKDTTLMDALSIAGGPLQNADLDEISLSTNENGHDKLKRFSVAEGFSGRIPNPVLKPGDIIMVKKDDSREKISLWLSIGSFLLASATFTFVVIDR